MKTAPMLLTMLALAGAHATPTAFAAESLYSNLGNKGCKLDRAASRQIKPHEDFKPMLYRCPAMGERNVSVTYRGVQVRVDIAREDGKALELSTYYDAGPRIEWRGDKGTGGFAPNAAIIRLSAKGDDGRPASALAIVRLSPDRDCLVGLIDVKTNRNANDLARQTADTVASANCDAPRLIGTTGTTASEILDLNKR